MRDFIPNLEAIELKKLGFNDDCIYAFNQNGGLLSFNGAYYMNSLMDQTCVSSPSYRQAFKFIRDNFSIESCVIPCFEEECKYYTNFLYHSQILLRRKKHNVIRTENNKHNQKMWFDKHEDAELACLKRLIELVKENPKLQNRTF